MFQHVRGECKLFLLSSVWERVALLLFEHNHRYFVLLLLVQIFVFVFVLIVILFWLLLLFLSTWYNRTMNGIDNRYASMLLSDISWYLLFFIVIIVTVQLLLVGCYCGVKEDCSYFWFVISVCYQSV